MAPLEFIASLDGEAKAAGLTVYNLMTLELKELRSNLDDRPMVFAIQNIQTRKLSRKGGSVELYWSLDEAERDIKSDFFEPDMWKAVVYSGRPIR